MPTQAGNSLRRPRGCIAMTADFTAPGEITMPVRVASIFIAVSLLALAGCAPKLMEVHNFTSAQLITGSADTDASHRSLSSTQLAALSNWIKTGNDWSGYSANIPEQPSMEVDLQNADGQGDKLMIYEHDSGGATAYLYHGERIVPLRRDLSSADLAAFKSMLNGQ
jgi:hypothetical protein